MSRIEYQYTEGRKDVPIAVRIDGKILGDIKPVEGGWQYVPRGSKVGGDIFATISQVQRSLGNEA
jgi:hypothetical protein